MPESAADGLCRGLDLSPSEISHDAMPSPYLQTLLFILNRPEPLRQTSLLMVLATGVGQGHVLLDGLRAHAQESGSPWSDRVHALRLLLEQGQSLSNSLAGLPGLVPDHALHAIRIGEATGTLREVLFDEAGRLSRSASSTTVVGFDPSTILLWANTVGVVLLTILSFVMVFIIPKFKKIFEDFGTELPAPTLLLISLSDRMADAMLLLAPPLLAVVLGGTTLAVWAAWQQITRGRVLFSEHWPRYWVPDALRLLSISAVARLPFAETLHFIQRELRPGAAARAFSRLRQRVSAGDDCISAMQDLRLLKPREAAFLQAAGRSGHVDWGMQHLAADIDRRRAGRCRRLLNTIQPLVIIAAGIVVLLVVVGLFMPLIKLVNDLS